MILNQIRKTTILNTLKDSEKNSSAVGYDLGVTACQAADLLTQMRDRGEVESYVDPKTRVLMWRLPATGETISTVVERLNKQEAEINALKDALKEVSK